MCIFIYTYIWASQVVLVVKNLAANEGNARGMSSIPGLQISPGEENGNSLEYPCLQNFMDRGAWRATVPEITKSSHD